MSTTGMVMTVTDELLAELEGLANKATGGDWEYRLGLIRTMPDQDGYVPIAVAPNSPKNWRGQRDANMQHIAAASPATITAITAELRRLRAENAELAKDAGRLEWMVTEGAVIASMNGTGRPMCYQVSFPFESCQQLDWFPSWREAVDAMMANQ